MNDDDYLLTMPTICLAIYKTHKKAWLSAMLKSNIGIKAKLASYFFSTYQSCKSRLRQWTLIQKVWFLYDEGLITIWIINDVWKGIHSKMLQYLLACPSSQTGNHDIKSHPNEMRWTKIKYGTVSFLKEVFTYGLHCVMRIPDSVPPYTSLYIL